MNKAELIKSITDRIDVSRKDADAVVSATVDVIMDAVAAGEKVTLVGFGTFERRDRKAREGRNPKTGEEVPIHPRRVLPFRPSQLMKDRVAARDQR